MDINRLDKSSHMTPLLVRLYDSHKLYELVRDNKPLARAELTSAVTDLFENTELKAKEQELLADVLIGLMRQAERDLRQALSERLATLENVPLRLVLHLANDDISVAAPVLRKSFVLNDLDLIYIIKSQGPDYWQAIAARERMNDEVIDALADTRDLGTAVVLSQNERLSLTRHAVNILGDMARENDAIAKPLLMRKDVPDSLARALYDHVGEELRTYIRAFYRDIDNKAEAVLDDVMIEFVETKPQQPRNRVFVEEFMPSPRMLNAAEMRASAGQLNIDSIMEALDKGLIPQFIALFSVYTGIPAKKIHKFLRQSCPKGMAIACRAFRIQKSDFSKIYLMTHKMRSKSRLVNHGDMLEVLRYFDRVRPEAALRIVMGSRKS